MTKKKVGSRPTHHNRLDFPPNKVNMHRTNSAPIPVPALAAEIPSVRQVIIAHLLPSEDSAFSRQRKEMRKNKNPLAGPICSVQMKFCAPVPNNAIATASDPPMINP